MSNNPDIAFLTMAHQPIDTMRAIIGAEQQNYPGHKTIYLLHQSPFPIKMEQRPGITIKQFNIEGVWPQLWYKKLMMFFKVCTEDYFIWWDEDDRFENDYVKKALVPVLAGRSTLAWNHGMVMVRGSSLNRGRYRSAIGTIAGSVDAAREIANRINPTGGNAKDCQYRKRLEKTLIMGKHEGLRYYIHQKNSHTTTYTNIGRPRGEDVDA